MKHVGMMILTVIFVSWYLLFWQPADNVSDSVLLEEKFDSLLSGAFGRAVLAHRNTELVADKGTESSRAVRVDYHGFERGSKRVVVSSPLKATEQAELAFSVKFCPGFDFARGGKLHGLGPAKPVAGGNAVTDDRWSARLMWRRDGGLMSYVYHQDMKGKFGDTQVSSGFHFEPGRYHSIVMTVTLNSAADLSDGRLDVAVDGHAIISHDRLRFRSTESAAGLIQTIMFNTFHGGSSPEWAPRYADGRFKIDCAYFDDFSVVSLDDARG